MPVNYSTKTLIIQVSAKDNVLPFEELKPRKNELFEKRLGEFLSSRTRTNHDVFRFILECGFLPKHAYPYLRLLRDSGRLLIMDLVNHERKVSYYLTWKNYNKDPKVRFEVQGHDDAIEQN